MRIICGCGEEKDGGRTGLIRFGSFYRKSTKSFVQRFRCLNCKRTYSEATLDPCFQQKKREMNPEIVRLLVSGVSQRRIALLLKLDLKTVARKFIFTGILAKNCLTFSQKSYPLCAEIQFDDLETSEHTKLKPLSVTLAVEKKTRRILGCEVSQMPAKGHLAKIARKKYGKRPDQRYEGREKLFKKIEPLIHENALIESDENPHYPWHVKAHFPKASHQTHKGQRGSVVGQGELKKIRFDPLFSLNHTCASFRANINRLFRRTWCTTKKRDRLDLHIALYSVFHNENLLEKQRRKERRKRNFQAA